MTKSKAQAARDRFKDWPQRDYDGPQPWDLQELELPRPGVNTDPLEDGEPDTVSPVVPGHGRPFLAAGAAGPDVQDLTERLAVLGYDTEASRGRDSFGIYDASVEAAVAAFRRDYGVEEDPSAFPRDPKVAAVNHVGPYTWEALIRASDRERENAA